MADLVIGLIILIMIGAAVTYIVKAKQRGVRCIGCPQAGTCGSKNHSQDGCTGCSCGCHSSDQ